MQYLFDYDHTIIENKKAGSHLVFQSSSLHKQTEPSSRLEKNRIKQQNKQMPKPPLYSVAAFITALLLLYYIIGSQMTKPERVIEQFENAVKNKDYTEITHILNNGQSAVNADREDAERFVDYLTNHPQRLNKIINHLKTESLNDFSLVEKAIKPPVSLKIDGKSWLLFNRYIIGIEVYKATVSTNYEDVNLYIDDKKVGMIKSLGDTFTTTALLPGIYTFKATFDENFGALQAKKKVDVTKAINNHLPVNLDLQGEYIYPTSNYKSAFLFINGKNTGLKLGEIDSFGPVSTDGSIVIYAEKKFKGGVRRSKKVTVKENREIYLPIEESGEKSAQPAEKTESAGAFLKNYISKSMEAINQRDFSLVQHMFIKGSQYEKEAKEYIQYLKKKGITEELKEFDIKNTVETSKDTYTIETYEQYDISYKDGSIKRKSFNSRYSVKSTGDGFKIHRLIESKQLNSETVQ